MINSMSQGKIEDGFFVMPQLTHGIVADLAASGFKVIINNRPDGERGHYPTNVDMEALAKQHGMQYFFVPVNPMALSMETVQAFAQAMEDAQGPVVAYCASGRRSAMMWALINASKKSADEIISACAAQGHDLSQMRPMLSQMAAAA